MRFVPVLVCRARRGAAANACGIVTKAELADRLDHLDPGATLVVEQVVLASLFGAGTLSKEAVEHIEAFALDHRCIFSYEYGKPSFIKEDVF